MDYISISISSSSSKKWKRIVCQWTRVREHLATMVVAMKEIRSIILCRHCWKLFFLLLRPLKKIFLKVPFYVSQNFGFFHIFLSMQFQSFMQFALHEKRWRTKNWKFHNIIFMSLLQCDNKIFFIHFLSFSLILYFILW